MAILILIKVKVKWKVKVITSGNESEGEEVGSGSNGAFSCSILNSPFVRSVYIEVSLFTDDVLYEM